MSRVVIYDEATNRVLEHIPSANTPDYSSRTDVIINPDVSALSGIPLRYWKQSGGAVVEMSQAEKNTVDQEISHATIAADKAQAKTYFNQTQLKAFVKILIDEINILRAQHSLQPRTIQQLKTAIENEIDNQ